MHENNEPAEIAEELIDAVDEEAGPDEVRDGLTKGERQIETKRMSERERKAEELRKQLRKRSLGLLNYRWPAMLLIFSGIMSIMSNFLQVMTRLAGVPPEVGFNTFIDAYILSGGVIYLFPIIAGSFMIGLSYFSYTNPRATWLALIPALMLFMAGGTVYYLITFAVTAQPELTGLIYATGVPISMFIAGGIALIAIYMREKE
jgi:ABC-type multidrug transport system fused ATPase/permease subunit